MTKNTQVKFVEAILKKKGSISRNFCLQRYISRLSAIIFELKAQGYKIEGEFVKTKNGKDYVYTIINEDK